MFLDKGRRDMRVRVTPEDWGIVRGGSGRRAPR
jgi:hypothetical protein